VTVVVIGPPGVDETLGDLERRGRLSKDLIAHLARTYPGGGWRQLTPRRERELTDARIRELRAAIADAEADVVYCTRRGRQLRARIERLDELARRIREIRTRLEDVHGWLEQLDVDALLRSAESLPEPPRAAPLNDQA
jgi:hypothetical protein